MGGGVQANAQIAFPPAAGGWNREKSHENGGLDVELEPDGVLGS